MLFEACLQRWCSAEQLVRIALGVEPAPLTGNSKLDHQCVSCCMQVSYPQQFAVTATGIIWSRFATQITPVSCLAI